MSKSKFKIGDIVYIKAKVTGIDNEMDDAAAMECQVIGTNEQCFCFTLDGRDDINDPIVVFKRKPKPAKYVYIDQSNDWHITNAKFISDEEFQMVFPEAIDFKRLS